MKPASRLTRRHVLGGAAAALAWGLAACASPGRTPGGATSTEPGFPVSIRSALGVAEIPGRPHRIVTLGQGSTETAIALGATPIGMERYEWGSDESGYLPWVREAVLARGEKLPTQINGGDTLDLEGIVALEPDLILAPWSGITQDQFDILNDVAPTVAYPDLPWSTHWDEQITTIGKALGTPGESRRLIDGIEQRFAEVRESRPQYAGHTFSYIYTDGPGTLGVFLPEEQRVAMVSKLGLTVDPMVKNLPETAGTESALIGLERAEKLRDSDLIFTFYMNEETRREVEAQPLYATIPAIRRGALVAGNDRSFVSASSMINPLTVPWVIDRYLPMIDRALARADR